MTRRQFEEDVTTVGELVDFCYENGAEDYAQDFYDSESTNEVIMNRLRDDFDCWEDAYSYLDRIPGRLDWYYIDGYGEFCDADDYFESVKEDVMNFIDNRDGWDDDDGDDDGEQHEETYEEAVEKFGVAYAMLNVGDLVECSKNNPDGKKDLFEGDSGTIARKSSGTVIVNWDKEIIGGFAYDTCPIGHGWCLDYRDVRKIESIGEFEREELDCLLLA